MRQLRCAAHSDAVLMARRAVSAGHKHLTQVNRYSLMLVGKNYFKNL